MRAVSREEPYYRPDLARIFHLGFGFHADDCAPGILALLEPVRERDGLVVELGCGTGLLTRYEVLPIGSLRMQAEARASTARASFPRSVSSRHNRRAAADRSLGSPRSAR